MIARVVHGAIAAGIVLMTGIFLYLGTVSASEFARTTGPAIRLTAYAALIAVIVVTRVLKGNIVPAAAGAAGAAGADLGDWWATNLRKAIILWAVAEGGGLTALVLGFVARDRLVIVAGAVVALVVLYVTRPGSLQSGRDTGPVDFV